MKSVVLLCVVFFFSFSGVVRAQDCLKLFTSAFQKMKTLPESGSGISMKYAVQVEMTDGTIHTDNIEMNILNKRVKIVSNDFIIYQDVKAMVVIHPEANTIFMTAPADMATQNSQLQGILVLQDSLLKHMVLKSCVAEKTRNAKGNQIYKKMTFQLPVLAQSDFPISSIMYWIEQVNGSIRKIQLDYKEKEDQEVKSIAFEFQEMSNQYQDSPFEGTAVARVLDAKNGLRTEYKNYSLIDKR